MVDKRQSKEHADSCEALLSILKCASYLGDFQAKTCIYWAIATFGLGDLDTFPMLVLQGDFGSGKTQIMKILKQIANNPVHLSSTPTRAVLRDKLGNDTTAFIEEADDIDEDIISNRYSRETARSDHKEPLSTGDYKPRRTHFFGATCLHKRRPFKDPAIQSRAIIITTRQKPGSYVRDQQIRKQLKNTVQEIWVLARDVYKNKMNTGVGGRVLDNWRPLIVVAYAIDDIGWIQEWAQQKEKMEESLKFGRQYEPKQMVVCALIALKESLRTKPPSDTPRLVALSDIRDWVAREYNWGTNSWAVGDVLRRLGFKVKTAHGRQKVVVLEELLSDLSAEMGIEDE